MNNKRIFSIVTLLIMVTIGGIYYTYTNWDNQLIYAIQDEKEQKNSENEENATDAEVAEASKDLTSYVEVEGIQIQSENEANTINEGLELKREPDDNSFSEESVSEPGLLITVYMYGCIKKSGIYQLYEGARVYEALALAGGLEEDADIGYVNQARILNDGESIFFPSKKEAEELPKPIEQNVIESVINSKPVSLLVDINHADKDQLMTLPGIGESKALSILSYRENVGSFKQIEDIMLVSGIKDALFSKIKDLIKVK